jgi:hypothetical protein
LRQRQADLLLCGTYRDTLDFALDSDEIDARAFASGSRLAVALTQSHLEKAGTNLEVPGYRFVESDGMGDYQVTDDGRRIDLARHAIAVVLFEKEPQT